MGLTDKQLWEKLKEGDKSALATIYEAHFKALSGYGLRFSKDSGLVADCIQELFIELYEKAANLSVVEAIRPYLFVSLKRKLIRKMTKSAQVSYSYDNLTDFELALSGLTTETTIEDDSNIAELLATALEKLSPRQKEILYLKYQNGFDYEEICEIMDMNYQSARNLTSRAIAKLSKLLLGQSGFLLMVASTFLCMSEYKIFFNYL